MEQKKKALGKGLEQLFSSEVLDFDSFEDRIMENAKESDIFEIPVNEVRPNPFQPRKKFDNESLEELATSIKNYGVFQPIIVKKSIKGFFKERVYNTIIPRLIRLAEAPSHGKPILEYEPRSRGTLAYLNLAKEVIDKNRTQTTSVG